jgi:hypothetical protein
MRTACEDGRLPKEVRRGLFLQKIPSPGKGAFDVEKILILEY